MKIKNLLFVVAIIFAFSSFFQGKEIKISSTIRHFYPTTSTITKQVFYLNDQKLKIDISNQFKNISIIYDHSKQRLWFLDHRHKVFTSVLRKELKKQQQLSTRENSQRAVNYTDIFTHYFTIQPTADSEKSEELNFVRKNKQNIINGLECLKVEGYYKQEMKQELWIATFDQLPLSTQKLKLLKNFFNFIESFPKEFRFDIDNFIYHTPQLRGLAFSCRKFKKGKISKITYLEEIKKLQLSSSIYDIPDYKFIQTLQSPKLMQ